MKRTSETSEILDSVKYNELINSYQRSIDDLERRFAPENNNDLSKLVNFKSNNTVPKHSWIKYKEGYSSGLVEKILADKSLLPGQSVLDPFCGVGTTNLVAQTNGISSVGFDINPIAILAARVKTHFYSDAELREIELFNKSSFGGDPFEFTELPKVLKSSYTDEVLHKILVHKQNITTVSNSNVRSFLNLALISIVEDCSIRCKDGNGIKLKPNKKYVRHVDDHFSDKVDSMLRDIRAHNSKTEAIFFEKSSIHELHHYVEPNSVGLSVFSPPYANCFDYLEVYKLEVWLGGFASKYSDFKKYRDVAMRSHVNSRFDHQLKIRNDQVSVVSELISTFNLWNKNIPAMIRGYFDDTTQLLQQLYHVLSEGGSVFIIVANSVYKGIVVPTDILIADISEKIGFTVKNIAVARQIRASSQQMKALGKVNLMRESILELTK